jgi:AcrR family transcriptional regulator
MSTPSGPAPSLWNRTRQAVQAQIVETALDLFLRNGFESTTIEQIVAVSGISRTSFFRYFGTKEDIVLGDSEQLGLVFRSALEARPEEEGPWEAIRAAALALPGASFGPERALAIAQLTSKTPSLRARHIEKHLQWQAFLVPIMRKRMGLEGNESDPSPRAIVAAALSCLDTATEIWAERGGKGSLAEIYDQAVTAIRR